MNATRTVLAAAVLMSVTGGAYAAVMASGSIWDTRQSQVTCFLFNSGASAVNVTKNLIYAEGGKTETLSGDSCAKLAPGGICYISAKVGWGGSHACKMTVSNTAGLRGTIEIRDADGYVVNSLPIR